MKPAQLFAEQITARFLCSVLATPRGRAQVLNQVADAEATDEGAIFDRLLAHVDDPKLRQMVTRHQADELRHAELLRGCIARQGVDPGPVPAHLRLLDRIDRLAGGVMDKAVNSSEDVMVAYVMLLVIEERALQQFGLFVKAFERVDPETAAVFRQIARDEERHLRYCYAISRRYAADEATWLACLHRFRTIELEAYKENAQATLEYMFDKGFHPAGAIEQHLWRGMQSLSSLSGSGPRTRYWGMSEPPATATA